MHNAMCDYAVDGRGGLSEAHHGSKMLLKLPMEVTTLTVYVNGLVFFVRKLLERTDRSFYIPKHFLYCQDQLYALG
jgi:hypothetical protein